MMHLLLNNLSKTTKVNHNVLLLLLLMILHTGISCAKDLEEDSLSHCEEEKALLNLQEDDYYMGSKDAPIKMIEYSSLSCGHCSEFHEKVFNKIKENFIDKGKVLYIHRNFPTNTPALTAALVARCSGDYFKFIDAFLHSQNAWAFTHDFKEKIKNISALSGVTSDEFDKCADDEDAKSLLYSKSFIASKELAINATPTFFINGKKMEGFLQYDSFKNTFMKILKDDTE